MEIFNKWFLFVVVIFTCFTHFWYFFYPREKRPDIERPYKAFGYPLLPRYIYPGFALDFA